MYYVTTLHAYDVLDRVHVHAAVRELEDDTGATWHTVFECATTFPGTGERDPRSWLEDVLVALMESL